MCCSKPFNKQKKNNIVKTKVGVERVAQSQPQVDVFYFKVRGIQTCDIIDSVLANSW